MNIKQREVGVAVERAVFRAFTVTQDKNGKYAASVTYVLGTFINDVQISESPLLHVELQHDEVVAHSNFAELYPLIQAFTRGTLAEKKPEHVET
jgi:hypothetical protein